MYTEHMAASLADPTNHDMMVLSAGLLLDHEGVLMRLVGYARRNVRLPWWEALWKRRRFELRWVRKDEGVFAKSTLAPEQGAKWHQIRIDKLT